MSTIIESKDVSAEKMILSAAERLFLEKGFAMTSTADIAREAGCNSALIHYYFRTKRRLFMSVFENKVSLFFSNFFAMPLGDLSFYEQVEAIIKIHFDFIRENKELPFLLINEITTNSQNMEQLRQPVGAKVVTILELLQREIDVEVQRKQIRKISASDLMITIGTLNVSTFLILPALRKIDGFDEDKFIDNRRKEILHTVIASLKYDTYE